jgi:predicted small lipoprotein YifL
MSLEKRRAFKALALAMAVALLAACGGGDKGSPARNATLVGAKGTTTVNRYLWAASLETLDFLPVLRADPISGLLLTDWYSNPETPNERFKVSVYILDTALRADALRVSVFRQERDARGEWVEASVNPATGREIENSILTRARQLRLNQLEK